MSDNGGPSLSSQYLAAGNKRQKLDTFPSSNSQEYQDSLESAISEYKGCLDQIDRLSLFSPNESLEDIATSDLRYLSSSFFLAELTTRRNASNRKTDLLNAQAAYSSFLKRLDTYDILAPDDVHLLESYLQSPSSFSTATTSDPTARRDAKIRRFKAEKELKQRLAELQRRASTSLDDEGLRTLYLQEVALNVYQTFQALESIAQELNILSMAPPVQPSELPTHGRDGRDRSRTKEAYSERLDGPLTQGSAGLRGPLLDSKGRPMRPFTLLDKRQQLQAGVFRPDHSLPTMSIDEYLEEERRRGGIIEGGGPQSGLQPEPDEDNLDKADQETLKARQWDEFKEDNPKGSGNTLNRG